MAESIDKTESKGERLCNCIEPLLVALACAEAMEHNAVVGGECSSIGQQVKRLVSPDNYDELTFEHSWLESPVIEPLAELAFIISINDVSEKCKLSAVELKKLFAEAVEDNNEKRFGAAQQKFIKVKSQLLKMATELCVEPMHKPPLVPASRR